LATGAHRSVYRPEAVRRYTEGRERSALPRFVSPRIVACLWLLLVLLIASAVLTWFTEIPMYATGQAVIVRQTDLSAPVPDEVVAVAFLPAEELVHLRRGQVLFLELDDSGRQLGSEILTVEPDISSPEAVRNRFALDATMGLAVNRPVAVVIAHLEAPLGDFPATSYVGSTYPVKVAVQSRRVLTLLPGLDWLLGAQE
jgi:hypothetical protein